MKRKVFYKPSQIQGHPTVNGGYVIIKLSDFDEYKEELAKLRKEGQLTVGTFQNRSSSINRFVEYLLRVKDINGDVNEIKITTGDVYNAFMELLKDNKISEHTLSIYLYSTKKALEHILLSKYGVLLSRTLGYEVFETDFYVSQLSKSVLQSKAKQLKEYQEYEKSKVITIEQIKDALKWLELLTHIRQTHTVETLRLGTLILLLTGARGTEINDLQFKVRGDGELIDQIDFRRGIIYFHRKKLKGSALRNFTPIFVHPVLLEELKQYRRTYQPDPTAPIFGRYSLDKIFYRYYTPGLAFRDKRKLKRLYRSNEWLRKYPPDEPLLTIRMGRKFVDSYIQSRMFELADRGIGSSIFGRGLTGLDNMRRYKNYILGRAEGVDFKHYISNTEDPRYSRRYKKFTIMLFNGLIDDLMPEIGHVMNPRVFKKLYAAKKHGKNKEEASLLSEFYV